MVHYKHFKTLADHPLSIIPTMDDAHIPSLDASKIGSGVFNVSMIPNLDAGKIVSGILDVLRIPNLDASKITTGVFDLARIPTMDDAHIPNIETLSYGGAFADAQIPSLAASKITSGVFDLARIPSIPPSKLDAIDSPADGEAPTYNLAQGKFEWKPAAGVSKLSDLTIDVDKNWAGYVIKNLGPPEEVGDVYSMGNSIYAGDIPNLDASKITSGIFDLARIPTMDDAHIPNIETLSYGGAFADAQIPNLAASKITSGTFDLDRIPSPLTGKDLGLVNAPSSDQTGSGLITTDTVGENVAIGELLYMKSDGKWWKANATNTTAMPCAGLAMEAKNADQDCKILLLGFFRKDAWNWTVGGLIYVSTTSGAPTQTIPSTTGNQVQVLGIAITADIIFFNPSYELVERS